MKDIELKLDENNEFSFNVAITGASVSLSKVRFICESDDDISYVFNAKHVNENEFKVIVPPMKGKISEDKKYVGTLEIIVEGRHFTPLQLGLKFKQTLKVVAESVTFTQTEPVAVKATTLTQQNTHRKVTNLNREETLALIEKLKKKLALTPK